MKRMISTVGLSRTDWLRTRRQGITGTDAGAITGMNPYVSAFQVYQDKLSTDIQETDNEAMRQGRDLEEYVASRFMEATGFKVRRANAIPESWAGMQNGIALFRRQMEGWGDSSALSDAGATLSGCVRV